ncbi:acyl-CoA N-acyltransferase [Bimuria novae-zelandiae CBS 107.79]|uniref:Acyl-CoA N-acyltransferase n=1 Tax=Bimuria novae-zelandiae CBS 107.79 TaxID=1447943 RepID=A0A6A5UVR3_9PLEO|nr:acyl-CoA N-acyltransferase [Bimuria novae-zelandiae CBS 107.79]
MNSNGTNNHLPGPSDAEGFRKGMDDNLLSAIICLSERVNNIHDCAGTPIGQIHLSSLRPRLIHHRHTEIGLDILPAYQGKGYGSEAIRWALDYAFRRAGLHRVRIRAFEWNTGACRLYERLGFVLEGREREACWHEGRFWDEVRFGMLEGEWRAMVEEEKKEKEGEGKGEKMDESGVPMI